MDRRALFSHVAELLDGELGGYHQLEGGSSADVWLAEIVAPRAMRQVVIRTHRANPIKHHDVHIATKEFRLLQELWARDMAVAEPLLVIEPEATLVTALVDGSSVVTDDELEGALDQMVAFLVDLHRIDPATLPIDELRPIEDPLAMLPEFLPPTAQGKKLRIALAAGRLDAPANKPVVLHGDFWPGNVLWNEGQLAAVIDWEDAAIGDPLADLAGARLEQLCRYGDAAMDWFTTLYRSVMRLDTKALAVWECYASATALASMHRWGLDPGEESLRRERTTQFFEAAVDVAVA